MSASLPAVAPRCPVHRPMQPKSCPRCRLRRRTMDAHRQAAIRAGTWQRRVDAAPVGEHCRNLRDAGLSYRRQSALSGVRHEFISALASGGVGTVEKDFADALTALTPPAVVVTIPPSNMVDACGTSRRIIGMAVNGFTFADQAQRLDTSKQRMHQRTTDRFVTRAVADKVKALADELYGVDGPGAQHARDRLVKRGGVPLEYWGDDIDDPAAVPNIPDMAAYVDEVKVDRAVAGDLPFADLTRAERNAAVAILAGKGMTDRDIAARMRWLDRHGNPATGSAVQHWRTRNNIGTAVSPAVPRAEPRYDESRVAAAVRGELTADGLSTPEKVEAVRRLVAEGLRDREIADRLSWHLPTGKAGRTVQVFRDRFGIRSAYLRGGAARVDLTDVA